MRHTMCVALAMAAVSGSAQAAPIITNGSFTGSPTFDVPPSGWTRVQASPDTVNQFGPFNNTGVAWTPSPDGGTFLRANGVGNVQTEIVSQQIDGFEIGHTYSFDFSLTNLGFFSGTTGAWSGFDGFFEFAIDNAVIGNSATVSKPLNPTDAIVWTSGSVGLAATKTTHVLTITAVTVGGATQTAYLGLDGLSLREVPAPSGCLGLALVGLGLASRRRRQA